MNAITLDFGPLFYVALNSGNRFEGGGMIKGQFPLIQSMQLLTLNRSVKLT